MFSNISFRVVQPVLCKKTYILKILNKLLITEREIKNQKWTLLKHLRHSAKILYKKSALYSNEIFEFPFVQTNLNSQFETYKWRWAFSTYVTFINYSLETTFVKAGVKVFITNSNRSSRKIRTGGNGRTIPWGPPSVYPLPQF